MSIIWNRRAVAVVAVIVMAAVASVFSAPRITAKSFVYADVNHKGKMDGSADKPFNKIQDAIDKAKAQKKDVLVRDGLYIENIEIAEDVEVIGEGRDKTTIIAADKSRPVVEMADDTMISKFTIKGGQRGIEVKEGARAEIEKCNILDNKKDGIKVEINNKFNISM